MPVTPVHELYVCAHVPVTLVAQLCVHVPVTPVHELCVCTHASHTCP